MTYNFPQKGQFFIVKMAICYLMFLENLDLFVHIRTLSLSLLLTHTHTHTIIHLCWHLKKTWRQENCCFVRSSSSHYSPAPLDTQTSLQRGGLAASLCSHNVFPRPCRSSECLLIVQTVFTAGTGGMSLRFSSDRLRVCGQIKNTCAHCDSCAFIFFS